jgi:small subunit ribosomal protein S2
MELTATDTKSEQIPPQIIDTELEEMMKAGVHLGHAKGKTHPAMLPYIYGIRNTIAVVDLTKTKEMLAVAHGKIKGITSKGGIVLLVGTRPAAKKIIEEIAGRTRMPYFIERWIGGTLTNFKVIRQRVDYMEKIEREKQTGELDKYTKKERMKKEEELMRLKKMFDGLRVLTHVPEAIFIVDITHDTTAVQEARRVGIPIFALCDTNSDAKGIDYPIPSNDDALSAVRYMVGRIGGAIEEGQREVKSA